MTDLEQPGYRRLPGCADFRTSRVLHPVRAPKSMGGLTDGVNCKRWTGPDSTGVSPRVASSSPNSTQDAGERVPPRQAEPCGRLLIGRTRSHKFVLAKSLILVLRVWNGIGSRRTYVKSAFTWQTRRDPCRSWMMFSVLTTCSASMMAKLARPTVWVLPSQDEGICGSVTNGNRRVATRPLPARALL